MRSKILVLGLLAAAAVPAAALAHHSFAMFEPTKTVVLAGTVKEFQWTNPHVWLQVMVPEAGGQAAEWSVEASSPNGLVRRGWSRTSFKPGDAVKVTIKPLKTGEKGGSFVSAVFADGRQLTEAPGVGALQGRPTQ